MTETVLQATTGRLPESIPGHPPALRHFGIVFLLLLVLFPQSASAEKLYKSRSASGGLVFSDRPPEGGELLEVRQVEVTQGFCARVIKPVDDADFELRVVNDCFGPVQFGFSLDESENIALSRPQRFTDLLPPRTERKPVRLRQKRAQLAYRYSYTTSFVPGDPQARHLPRSPYLLPVPGGKQFVISQGFGGEKTHDHVQSVYAVDIPLPEGTPVFAAREGVIMEVANDFFTGGTDAAYAEKANFIRILHDDGTMAIYAHLKLETIQYVPGTRVLRGQFIAEAGNTGFSTGPHLHFAVQQNVGGELRSIPFEFADATGRGYSPEAGTVVFR